MSRRGLPSASSAATRPPGIGQHGTVLERAPGIEALHLGEDFHLGQLAAQDIDGDHRRVADDLERRIAFQ